MMFRSYRSVTISNSIGAGSDDVEEEEVVFDVPNGGEGRRAVVRGVDLVPLAGQSSSEEIPVVLDVVDDQNFGLPLGGQGTPGQPALLTRAGTS